MFANHAYLGLLIIAVIRLAKFALNFSCCLILLLSSIASCNAQSVANISAVTTHSNFDISEVLDVAPQCAIKSVPVGVEIYQYDRTPLKQRQPLLLVHGLLGEFHPMFRWKELAQFLSADPALQARYKIYFVRYNSNCSLKEATNEFGAAFAKLAPPGGLTIVAISLSGTIVRNAMIDPFVSRSISQVITLGSFFHGSPLFCTDWMRATIKRRHLSPLCELQRLLAYKVYFSKHENLLLDYQWDNSDQENSDCKQRRQEITTANPVASSKTSASHLNDGKFIVYAGYLHNRYFPRVHGAIREFFTAPITFFATTLPAHVGHEHAALRFINCLVAGAVPNDASNSKVIYPLNDGISPISSSLLIPDEFVAGSASGNEQSLRDIRLHSTAKRPRLFDNIDHLTFIERHRPRGSNDNVIDVLSPNEVAKPMFAWILMDLLE